MIFTVVKQLRFSVLVTSDKISLLKTVKQNNVCQRWVGLAPALVLFGGYSSVTVHLIPVTLPSLCAIPIHRDELVGEPQGSALDRRRRRRQTSGLKSGFFCLRRVILTQVKFPFGGQERKGDE